MGSPRDDLMIPSTCIDQTPIRNSRIHPFIDTKSWISGYNLIIIDPKHSREKKIQATYGLRFYDPLFCNILSVRLQILLPVAINPIFHLPLSQILHTDPINSLLHYCYIFFSNFLLPTKAAIEPGEIRSGAESADQ